MNNEEPLNAKLFRIIVHGKAAQTAMLLAEAEKIPPLDALRKFYESPVYCDLETEPTKTWWESPAQIYNDYRNQI